MKPMEKARAKLLLRHPFYATLTLASPLIEDKTVPTACTDMKSIWYNPEFVASLKGGQVETLVAHEVLHIMLKHGLRLRGRNPYQWNCACDYAINLVLMEDGFEPIDDWLCDPKYKGMTAELIYEALERDKQKEKQKRKQHGDDGEGKGQGGGNSPDEQERDGLPHNPMDGDIREPANMTPEERAAVERSIEQRVAQAANIARMAGKMPGGLARLVGDILNPKVPWQDLLREYATRVTKDDESWSRRNRRFSRMYLPSRHSMRMGEVAVIGDTSGSITNDELKIVGSEVAAILDAVQPETTRLVWADTEVAGEQVFEAHDIVKPEPKGGGGTDMRVPLAYVEQFEPQVVVLITDGYTPWPTEQPPYPLIVCCTTNAPVPVGEVVRI